MSKKLLTDIYIGAITLKIITSPTRYYLFCRLLYNNLRKYIVLEELFDILYYYFYVYEQNYKKIYSTFYGTIFTI